MENLTAIILAAGKGTRMQSVDTNKVALKVNGQPMLKRTIGILRQSGIKSIVVVVGFAKESVIPLLESDIIIAEQHEQLGTGHAVVSSIRSVPNDSECVLILYGDDSFLYTPETFKMLYETHIRENAKITFITMENENPTGFGRIIRNSEGKIIGIVEEKNATGEQKKITEINLGCYIIDKKYLEKNIRNISKNPITGEYYITDIIDIISEQNGVISSYKLTGGKWHGVNTREDLAQAEQLFTNEN